MDSREQALPFTGFKGLDKSSPGFKRGFTRSLQNVTVREEKVKGRGGVDYQTVLSAAAAENIDGLGVWKDNDSVVTSHLCRLSDTKFGISADGAAWTDKTGTALASGGGGQPSFAQFRELLFFTNGVDAIRYYDGSANSTEPTGAPYCKVLLDYFGFLFAMNYSADGSTWEERRALYSETPDTDWTLCNGNELNFHETPGAIMAAQVYGRTAAVIKNDGVVLLRWVGGLVRFTQELVKGAPGTLAPLSAQSIGEKGVIYLGADYRLWIVTANDAIPLPPNVNALLDTIHKPLVANCRAAVVPTMDTYSLFFPTDSNGNGARIDYNYRTGEFAYHTYASHDWDAVAVVRWTTDDAELLVGAANKEVFVLDSLTTKNDETSATASTEVTRFYDTDWFQLVNIDEGRIAQQQARITGMTLVFDALAYAKAQISVALDMNDTFRWEKTYELRPKKSGDAYVHVRYDIPSVSAQWFNLRIKLKPSTSNNPVLRQAFVHFVPVAEKTDVRSASFTES